MKWFERGLNPALIEQTAAELGYTKEQVIEVIQSVYTSADNAARAEFDMVHISKFGKFIKKGSDYDPKKNKY